MPTTRYRYRKDPNTNTERSYNPITDEQLHDAGKEIEKAKEAAERFLNDADYARRQAQNKASNALKKVGRPVDHALREAAKTIGGTTPSQRPGENGLREWENHKYIDKVKTKTGNIRYIYEDVETASGKHKNVAGEFRDKKLSNLKSIADAQERRQQQDYYDKHPVEKAFKIGKEAVDSAAKAGSDFINGLGDIVSKTPIADLFKK